MGDFNDNPNGSSINLMVKESALYNPFKTVWTRAKGGLCYNFQWNLFDQILCSTNFFDTKNSTLDCQIANVYNFEISTQYHCKYKGKSFKNYIGKKYKGNYSDHFPIYIEIKASWYALKTKTIHRLIRYFIYYSNVNILLIPIFYIFGLA